MTRLDARRAIYLAPAGLRDNRLVVLWHRCAGVGPSPRWLGTPIGQELIIDRSPWTIATPLGCDACGLSGDVLDGRWVDFSEMTGTV